MNILLSFVLLNFTFCIQEVEDVARLTITITNIPSDKGQVYVFLYDSKEDFLYQPCRPVQSQQAKKGSVEFVFEDVGLKSYAIMAHHDENDNGKMDSYFFGLPKEHYGFSNNARSAYGPPSFEDARFRVDKMDTIVSFKLQ